MPIATSVSQFKLTDALVIAGIGEDVLDDWTDYDYRSILPGAKLAMPAARLMTGSEVLLLCAIGELSRLGVAPSRDSAAFAELIMTRCRIWNRQEKFGEWGDPESLPARNVDRFFVFYPGRDKRVEWYYAATASEEPGRTSIDCFAIAERVFPVLEELAEGRGGIATH